MVLNRYGRRLFERIFPSYERTGVGKPMIKMEKKGLSPFFLIFFFFIYGMMDIGSR